MKKPLVLFLVLVVIIGLGYLSDWAVSQPIPTSYDPTAIHWLSTHAQGDSLYNNGVSGATSWVALNIGTAGQIYQVNAGATAPQWVTLVLGSHTTGNYVQSITNGAGITGGDGGSEAAALTISATLGGTITGNEIQDADYGDFTFSSGSATLDTGVVADNEIDYSNVTLDDFDYQNNWKTFYSDGSGDVQELANGTNTWVLTSQGTGTAPAWAVSAGAVEDDVYGAGWNGDTTNAPSQNTVYDYLVQLDADADGSFTDETWLTQWPGSASITTASSSLISGLTNVTSTDSDYILIWDATDNALKKVDMGEVRGGAGTSGSATSWVNFTGTSTNGAAVINDHYNVTSVTRTGTGLYTIAWTADFPNANYAWVGSGHKNGSSVFIRGDDAYAAGADQTASVTHISCNAHDGTDNDPDRCKIIAFDGSLFANTMELGTDTTGNYVATLASGGTSTITVVGSGSEAAAVTIDVANNAIKLAQLDVTDVSDDIAGDIAAGELTDDSVNDDDINWADLTYLTTNGAGVDEAYAAGWNGDVGPPEKDDVYDYLIQLDADADGSFTDESWLTGWTGSASITTLGTIATGVWQGTVVGTAYGGTGSNTLSNLIQMGTHTNIALGTINYVLTSQGTDTIPTWAAAGAGDITSVFSALTGAVTSATLTSGHIFDGGTDTTNASNEGIYLPRAADVSGAVAEGQVGWDTDGDRLYVGDSATAIGMISFNDIPDAGTDPDVDAVGEIGRDTDDYSLRGYSTDVGQFLYAQATKTIQFTITQPDDLEEKDDIPIWTNSSGFTFYVTEVKAWCDVDDATCELVMASPTNFDAETSVEALTISDDGTGVYYTFRTLDNINNRAIHNGDVLIFDPSTSDVGWIKITIIGHFDSDVN